MNGFKPARKLLPAVFDLIRKYPIKLVFLSLCILIMTYFEVWGHLSPLPARGWNTDNLKLVSETDEGSFSFAVFGDNLNSKFVFENLLKLIDHDMDIAFAISLGNMVSRGKEEKYRLFIKQVRENLGIPLLTTMGSRELKSEGPALYHKIFGPSYYSFHIGKNFFMVLDDADPDELDLMLKDGWLEKTLQDAKGYENRLVFMHMPLYDPRGEKYHECLPTDSAENLKKLFLKYNVNYIFSSHISAFFEGDLNGIPLFITGGAGAKLKETDVKNYFFHFLKVNINGRHVEVQVKPVPFPDYVWMDHLGYNIDYVYYYLKIHLKGTTLLLVAGMLAFLICRSEFRKKKKRLIAQY